MRGKTRKEVQKLLETKISLSDLPADVCRDCLGMTPRQQASKMGTSKTSSTPATRQARGELATALRRKEGEDRKIHTAPITRVTATCLIAIREGTTGHKMMGKTVPLGAAPAQRAVRAAP